MKNKWGSQQQMLKAKKEEKVLKELAQMQTKKEKISIRNDQLISDEQDSTLSITNTQSEDKYGTFRNLLMGPIGIILWSISFGYLALFIHKNLFLMESSPIRKSD